jgi:methyl-accepting chemotaxis protein WspA
VRISLRNKIYALALVAAILPVLVLLLLMLRFRSSVSEEASREMRALAEANVEQAAKDAYGLCETANNLLQRQVNQNLAVARRILAQKGGIATGEGTVRWQAVNQFNQGVVEATLPPMLIGGVLATQSRSFKVASPFVDEVRHLVGSAVTVFQRMNEAGDMLRVATTVPTSDGNRGIGTYIPAVDPDGAPNPVVATVLRGATYEGTAFVVNELYVAAYEPLRDRSGRVSGMLFVGERISAVESVRSTLLNTIIGRTGYIVVIGAKGSQRGRYIISKGGMRDGEDLWETRDSSGNLFVQEMVQRGLASAKGELFGRSYIWQNPDEPKPRLKHAALIYFEPWDWLIVAGAYEDEYMDAIKGVKVSATNLLWGVTLAGLLSLFLALGIAFLMGSRMTKPIELVTKLAGKVAKGDLHSARAHFLNRRVATDAKGPTWFDFPDESVELTSSFREMTETLGGLLGQVQRAGIQVTASTTEITASAKQLEPTVAEQAAATREVSATSSQISATSHDLLRTMSGASQAVVDATAQAESGQSELSEMETAMRELIKATGTISSRLGVISDRASKISTVVTTINKISDQTTLLSLNAAIEAEKAGELGKGFSVVAREIGRLADQTALATQDIDSVVKEMQSAVSSGVMEMDRFSEEVRQRAAEVNGIAAALGRMIEKVQALGPLFETARRGMEGQTEAAEQINEAMKQLAETAGLTKSLLGEFQKVTGQLNSAVQELQNEVSQFRTAA